jgi:hypothetical protein
MREGWLDQKGIDIAILFPGVDSSRCVAEVGSVFSNPRHLLGGLPTPGRIYGGSKNEERREHPYLIGT